MNALARFGISSLPETRRAILNHLKREGEARAETIATAADITVSGARQHLMALERDGLIVHREVRDGPGRPKHLYSLTAAGDALFPRNYAELTNELLQYVGDEDPELVQRIFERRGQRRLQQTQTRTAGLPFAARVRAIAQQLDDDGYLAEFQQTTDDEFMIIEHNCTVLSVAHRYGHACASELAFLQKALPEADVARVAHQVTSGHVCAYEIHRRS